MVNFKYKNRGFTLIELVVVIGILGMILSATIATLNPVAQIGKAKIAQKESDLEQVKTALDLFYDDNKCYPSSGTVPFGSIWKAGNTVYMTKVPQSQDKNTPYIYETAGNCPQWYVVYAKISGFNSGISPLCPLSNNDSCKPPNDSHNHICVYGGVADCIYIYDTPLND